MAKTVILQINTFDEFRDSVHQTGLFEMSDCTLEVTCNLDKETQEINKFFEFVNSIINVVDSNLITDDFIDGYKIRISEEIPPYLKNQGRKRSS